MDDDHVMRAVGDVILDAAASAMYRLENPNGPDWLDLPPFVRELWRCEVDESRDVTKVKTLAACTCGRPDRNLTCRCTCSQCGSRELTWKPFGHYLDKDLVCDKCEHVQDFWDC